jgi:DNA uptake protein ComE-like DNA-binding protein
VAAAAPGGGVPSVGREPSIQEAAEREALDRLVAAERRAGPSHAPDEERIQAEAERRIAEAAERIVDEAPAAAAQEPPDARRDAERTLARQLEETEARLAAAQQRTAAALDRAATRLREAEARASEAESRAAHADKLAKLKNEELEGEARLRELLDRIAETEDRAAEAERRASETVARIAGLADRQQSAGGQTVGPEPPAGPLNLNEATYEDLRRLRLSVTQAGRLLAYRDRAGGFKSLDELDGIPGFPRPFLTELKPRLTL